VSPELSSQCVQRPGDFCDALHAAGTIEAKECAQQRQKDAMSGSPDENSDSSHVTWCAHVLRGTAVSHVHVQNERVGVVSLCTTIRLAASKTACSSEAAIAVARAAGRALICAFKASISSLSLRIFACTQLTAKFVEGLMTVMITKP
jgi:hypothetical protein